MEKQISESYHNMTKWFSVKKKGLERELEISVVVEFFRFLFYLWFVMIVAVGISLTYGVTAVSMKTAGNETFYEIIEGVFGSVNICAFFDFPPATYVLPTMYAILLLLLYQYAIVSVFRAWMALEENKITQKEFLIYTYAFLYFALSAAVFSTIFAVQPDPGNPATIIIHTLPFTNLIIALTVLQIAVTWFGRSVSWKGLKHKNKLTKRSLRLCTYICLGTLILTTIFKVIHQINSLGDLKNHGLWFNVHNHRALLQLIDKTWLLAALVGPMMQSGYLTFKTFDTHLIIFTVRDNRRANPRDSAAIEGTDNEAHEMEAQ